MVRAVKFTWEPVALPNGEPTMDEVAAFFADPTTAPPLLRVSFYQEVHDAMDRGLPVHKGDYA